jgi:hypothetical protein
MDDKPTKKKVIIIKLNNLRKKLNPFCNSNINTIIPDINNIDIADFIFYFNFLFPNGSDYKQTLQTLIKTNNILNKDEDEETVINTIIPLINWLKALK